MLIHPSENLFKHNSRGNRFCGRRWAMFRFERKGMFQTPFLLKFELCTASTAWPILKTVVPKAATVRNDVSVAGNDVVYLINLKFLLKPLCFNCWRLPISDRFLFEMKWIFHFWPSIMKWKSSDFENHEPPILLLAPGDVSWIRMKVSVKAANKWRNRPDNIALLTVDLYIVSLCGF